MAVTNLTNTTWYIPSGWECAKNYGSFNILGTFNTYNLAPSVGRAIEMGANGSSLVENTIHIFYGSGSSSYGKIFSNTTDITLTITGGKDVTNTDLISWLEEYGKFQKITHLTGSTWVIPSGWTANSEYGAFETTEDTILIEKGEEFLLGKGLYLGYEVGLLGDNTITLRGAENCITYNASAESARDFHHINNDTQFAITFDDYSTGTNETKLINWLYDNGYMTVLPTTDQPTTPTKKFTRLFLGAIAHTSNGKRFRKLQTTEYVEPEEPSLPVWNGTDLTGTTWNVSASWSAEPGYGSFNNIYFSYHIPQFSTDSFEDGGGIEIGHDFDSNAIDRIVVGNSLLLPTTSLIITFISGIDSTNPKLIAWLKQYGTLTSHTMA